MPSVTVIRKAEQIDAESSKFGNFAGRWEHSLLMDSVFSK